MAAPTPTLHRAAVEHLVRQAVYQRLSLPLPHTATAPNPLVVNVSARHCHLTQEAVEILFGKTRQDGEEIVLALGTPANHGGDSHIDPGGIHALHSAEVEEC